MKAKVLVIALGLLAVAVIAVGIVVAVLVFQWRLKAPEVPAGPVKSCSNGQIARLLWKPHFKTDLFDVMPTPLGTMFLEVTSAEGDKTVTEFENEVRQWSRPGLQWSGDPEMLIVRKESEEKLFRFIPESRTFSELIVPIYNPEIVSWATARNGEIVVVASERRELSATDSDYPIACITILRWNLSTDSFVTSLTIPFTTGGHVFDSDGYKGDVLSPDASHLAYTKRIPPSVNENQAEENTNQEGKESNKMGEGFPFSSGPMILPRVSDDPIQVGAVEIAEVLTGQPVFSQITTGSLSGAWWSPGGIRCLFQTMGNREKAGVLVGDYWLFDIGNMKMENIAERISSVLGGSEQYLKLYDINWMGGERFFVATMAKEYTSGRPEERINVVFDTETWDLVQLPVLGKYTLAMAARSRPLVALRTVWTEDDPKMCIVRVGSDKNDSGSSVTQVPLKAGENPSWLWGCGDTKLLLLDGGKVREVTVP